MKRARFVASLALFAAFAANAGSLPGMPPAEQVAPILHQLPSVRATRADIRRADATAQRLRSGSYEWEATLSGGQRSVDNTGDFADWSGGFRRPLRWPSKTALDDSRASVEGEIAEAQYEIAKHDAAVAFVNAWADWLYAAGKEALAEEALADAQQLANAADRREELGSGSAIEADRLASDAARAEITMTQAQLLRSQKELGLRVAFPGIELPKEPQRLEFSSEERLPDLPNTHSPTDTPELLYAKLEYEKAELLAARADLERTPDPKVGIDFFSEFDGAETGVAAVLSIPIPGRNRAAAADEAHRQAEISRHRFNEQQRRISQHIRSLRVEARALMSMMAQAEESVRRAESAYQRIRRGRELAATTVTELLAAGRQLRDAKLALLEQRITAVRLHATVAAIHTHWPYAMTEK